MKSVVVKFSLVCLALAGLSAPIAAEFETGLNAYESGDYATAMRELSAEADNGHARAQFLTGVMYRDGLGVDSDEEQGLALIEAAAEQELMEAQAALGRMYAEGEGVGENDRMAYLWFHDAVEQGHVGSMPLLGELYREGDGTRKNLVLSYQWYLLAYMLGEGTGLTGTMSELRSQMSEDQIVIGEQLALDWMERKQATGQEQETW